MYEEAGNSNLLMLLNTAVYPFLAAAVITLTGKFSARLSLLGLAAGFLVALSLIHTGLSFPPSKALDFLTISTLLGVAISGLRTLKLGFKTRNAAGFIALAVSFYLLLNPVLQHQSQWLSLSWSVLSAALVLVLFGLQKSTATAQHSHASMASLAVIAAASAPVVSIGGSLLIGQLLGGFAASVAGFVLVQRFVCKASSLNGLLLGSFILAGLLAQAHVLADLPIATMLIAYLAILVNVISNLLMKEDGKISSTIVNLIPQILISGIIAGVSLWSVWPESSLY
ncbi:hypothetical protein MAQ5080_00195 [Marinomonas aquimarina]|uniref:Uncharacterized protein n=1 Tax=Marinomonas aquimarina TaxID=295068 RepID=A0A1A8T1Q3_9GAMM|nr:hypothetical protein [Marinomonas aquimarina]SBS25149.1 hypothetical protein MAQ5080_00195 [Marinomonas aquimarina]